MKNTLSLALGGLLLAAGSLAHADPFYLDVGTDYDLTGTNQACPTCTSVKNQAWVLSRWSSVVTDVDAIPGFSVGDTVKTVAGFGLTGPLGLNGIVSLSPSQSHTSDSDNGFGTAYNLTLGFELTGKVISVAANGLPNVDYSGLAEFFYYDGTNQINFMDVLLSGTTENGVSVRLNGKVDFTHVDSLAYANLFQLDGVSCNGSSGFYDLWRDCGNSVNVAWALDISPNYDTTVTFRNDGGIVINSVFEGGMAFASAVPEPASVSLAALGLLAAVGVSRRRTLKR